MEACFPNGPGLRLSFDDGTFGQLSLINNVGQLSGTSNSSLTNKGDVLLRSGPNAKDLVFAVQKPGLPGWPHAEGGRMRFITNPGNETELMRLTSDGSISLGVRSGNPSVYGADNDDPLGNIHLRDKLILSGSNYASIKYNKFSVYDAPHDYWHERRMSPGLSAGIGFLPLDNITPPSSASC